MIQLLHIADSILVEKVSSYCFDISRDGKTITTISSESDHFNDSIYLKKWVSSMLNIRYTWTFSISKLNKLMYFYLISKETWGLWQKDAKPLYSISNNQRVEKYKIDDIMDYKRIEEPDDDMSQLVFGEGDKISFILDLPKKKLLCKINENSIFVLANDIDRDEKIKWKIGITLDSKGDSVTLLNSYQDPA